MSLKSDKLAAEIATICARAIAQMPPRNTIATVMSCVLSSDMRTATLLVSIVGNEDGVDVLLRDLQRECREVLARSLRSRMVPKLIVERDFSLDAARHIDELTR